MGPVFWGCLLLWSLCMTPTQATYAGIKARVTQRALDFGEWVSQKPGCGPQGGS